MVTYTETCKKCGKVISWNPSDTEFTYLDFIDELKFHIHCDGS